MSIPELDLKLLWGNSGNRCAICKTELSQDKAATSGKFAIGEQAHIVGEKETAARGKSVLLPDQRNRYHNLILLCPNHHTEIDKDSEAYPVELLHMIKTEHELWVRSKLGEAEIDPRAIVAQQIYAHLIDEAVAAGDLENWRGWTSWALAPEPSWSRSQLDAIREFRRAVIAGVWSNERPELEASLRHFSRQLHAAGETFRENALPDAETMRTDTFYRDADANVNQQVLKKFESWLERCHEAIFEATRAANWFADCVRRYVNPSFFALQGKFIVTYSSGTSVEILLLEYQAAELEALRQA